MAPLAQTLTLLAMAMAIRAIEVVPLDMAPYSFDDQYQGCGPAMKAALPALNRSEFEQNKKFAQFWVSAADVQQRQLPFKTLLSPDQATALIAFSMDDLHKEFNTAVREAGRSSQKYRDNFHFKTLHFLLTDALATLRDGTKAQCINVVRKVCGVQYNTERGNTVRFGEFTLAFRREPTQDCPEYTVFKLHTCHGVDIYYFTIYQQNEQVLIPPFETFEVTQVIREKEKTQIQLRSTKTYSKYNCEWLQGGSDSRAPFNLGGLLLATTALSVATRIL